MKTNIIFILLSVLIWNAFCFPVYDCIAGPNQKSALFIHHSVGERLLVDGSVRDLLKGRGIDLWDHGFNHAEKGLRDPQGNPAGCYWIPDNNTRPYGYDRLFSMKPEGANPFARILANHDIILFKSCFPVSKISPDDPEEDQKTPWRRSLNNYKKHYRKISETAGRHPGKIFIVVTQPPLHPNATTIDEAIRAHAFVKWLQSPAFSQSRKNIFVFDLFSLLSHPDTHMLRDEYQINKSGKNSHPNAMAYLNIGPKFVDFLLNVVRHGDDAKNVNISFRHPSWPYGLVRSNETHITLEGLVENAHELELLVWDDLDGQRGQLLPGETFDIKKSHLKPGVSKLVVTATTKNGRQSCAAVGLQYYPGKSKEVIIFDDVLKNGKLNHIGVARNSTADGKPHLLIKGTGADVRAVLHGLNLDISKFPPENTYLEMEYDQGQDNNPPRILIRGMGTFEPAIDEKPGFQAINLPFDRFMYLQNVLNQVIIKGNWNKGTEVRIRSMRLISSAP
jgi:hypothetical protein